MKLKNITPSTPFTEVDVTFEQVEPLQYVQYVLYCDGTGSKNATLHFDVLMTDGSVEEVTLTAPMVVVAKAGISSSFELNVINEHSIEFHYHRATNDSTIGPEYGELYIYEKEVKGITNVQIEYNYDITEAENPKILMQYK